MMLGDSKSLKKTKLSTPLYLAKKYYINNAYLQKWFTVIYCYMIYLITQKNIQPNI